ncbi:uncharacterized protein LOC130676376 [Microplitis mediator]|uniref:uncharacterized protein LOC130676376 n=1 Tax=Microplitis mediator TaxID=375433 RepID=UPI002553D7F6|nr:uncharacterized protein LOC130676376 [Microplitis mediator]
MEVNILATFFIASVTLKLGQSHILSIAHYDLDEAVTENLPWTVMIVRKSKYSAILTPENFYYGSLIHPKAVLFISIFPKNSQYRAYHKTFIIIGGCQNFEIKDNNDTLANNCQTREVADTLEGTYHGYTNNSTQQQFFSLIILKTQFELNDKINVIELESYSSKIESNCFIPVFKNLYSHVNNRTVSTISSYDIKMIHDSGWIYLTEKGYFVDRKQRTESVLPQGHTWRFQHRIESPVICQRIYNPNKYTQIGALNVFISPQEEKKAQIYQQSYFDVARIYDVIYRKLNDYFKPISGSEEEKFTNEKNNFGDTACPINCKRHDPKKVNAKITVKINGNVKKSENIVLEL